MMFFKINKFQKGFAPLLILIFVAGIAAIGYFSYKNYFSNKPIACTADAKICPDGTAVGRSGPKCEFEACPTPGAPEQGSCLPNFPIEKNSPELTASQNYAMECNSKVNRFDCEKVDVYNSLKKDFSSPDGIHDCDWVPQGQPCGGIAGLKCPNNMECKITDTYPDAMGTCVSMTNYTCPANGWVDCMPGPGASKKASCSSEAMNWYKINCPNFKGAAY